MTSTPPELPADLLEKLAAAGNKALNDHYHEDLCACSTWPASCVSRSPGNYFFGYWDTSAFGIALPAILAAYEQSKAAPAAAGTSTFLFEGCRNGTHTCPIRYDGYGGTLACSCECHREQQ